jgi:hypothetical protein
VPRAENDVGGLLDPSKGWTLHIPGPDEAGSAAQRMIVAQKAATESTKVAAAGGPPAVVASR